MTATQTEMTFRAFGKNRVGPVVGTLGKRTKHPVVLYRYPSRKSDELLVVKWDRNTSRIPLTQWHLLNLDTEGEYAKRAWCVALRILQGQIDLDRRDVVRYHEQVARWSDRENYANINEEVRQDVINSNKGAIERTEARIAKLDPLYERLAAEYVTKVAKT